MRNSSIGHVYEIDLMLNMVIRYFVLFYLNLCLHAVQVRYLILESKKPNIAIFENVDKECG